MLQAVVNDKSISRLLRFRKTRADRSQEMLVDVLHILKASGVTPPSRQRFETRDHVEQLFVDGFLSNTAERAV